MHLSRRRSASSLSAGRSVRRQLGGMIANVSQNQMACLRAARTGTAFGDVAEQFWSRISDTLLYARPSRLDGRNRNSETVAQTLVCDAVQRLGKELLFRRRETQPRRTICEQREQRVG